MRVSKLLFGGFGGGFSTTEPMSTATCTRAWQLLVGCALKYPVPLTPLTRQLTFSR